MNKIILSIILFLSACSDGIKILETEKLPNSKLNEKYTQLIKLKGGIVNPLSFRLNITPKDSGLFWDALEDPYVINPKGAKDYNSIMIKGNPKKLGNIYLDFSWRTMGTNISSGKKLQKRYILKVEE